MVAEMKTKQKPEDVTQRSLSSMAMGVDKEIPGYKMRARNIVFVGHDTRPDIRYLRHLGVPSSIRQRKHPCQTTHPLELITHAPCHDLPFLKH